MSILSQQVLNLCAHAKPEEMVQMLIDLLNVQSQEVKMIVISESLDATEMTQMDDVFGTSKVMEYLKALKGYFYGRNETVKPGSLISAPTKYGPTLKDIFLNSPLKQGFLIYARAGKVVNDQVVQLARQYLADPKAKTKVVVPSKGIDGHVQFPLITKHSTIGTFAPRSDEKFHMDPLTVARAQFPPMTTPYPILSTRVNKDLHLDLTQGGDKRQRIDEPIVVTLDPHRCQFDQVSDKKTKTRRQCNMVNGLDEDGYCQHHRQPEDV